uniref:Uncharacterized protein n=1 Tax=Oryza barthii TaxID=65489 RepID=A0A0D3FHM7_9ORYZ
MLNGVARWRPSPLTSLTLDRLDVAYAGCPDLVVAIGREARASDLVIMDGGRRRREQGARSPVRAPCRWR